MLVEKNEIDSDILGLTVLELKDPCADGTFPAFEASEIRPWGPCYCVCKVPIEDLAAIQQLEASGYRFLELQLQLAARPRERDTSAFPYAFSPVASEAELAEVLAIAETTFVADRFSVDPHLAAMGAGLSGRRYQRYIEKSFRAQDERVFKLVSQDSGRIVAFNTHKYRCPDDVLMFVGGVRNECKSMGLGAIMDYFLINHLKEMGVKKFTTHVSARNYPVMNLEIAGLGFKIVRNFVILRKVYP